MPVITVKDGLLERLTWVTQEKGVPADDLFNAAVSDYLDRLAREKISTETQVFHARHSELRRKYLGRYIAMHHGHVVDYDDDLAALNMRVRTRYGRTPILMTKVTEEPLQELVFRSPRLEPLRP